MGITLTSSLNIILYLLLVGAWISGVKELQAILYWGLGLNIILSLVLIFLKRNAFKKFYQSPQFLKFSSYGFSLFLIVSILGLVNFLAYKNPYIFDFSSRKDFSLSEQSKEIVNSLKSPIRFTVFSKRSDQSTIKSYLERYKYYKSDISMKFVDIELEPALIQKHNILNPPVLMIEHNKAQEKISNLNGTPELRISNALQRLHRGYTPILYFLSGHGELDLDSNEYFGGSFLKKMIMSSNFIIKKINLEEKEITDFKNPSVILSLSPKTNYSKKVIQKIDSYLKKNVKLIATFDPQLKEDGQKELREFLNTFGFDIRNVLLVDRIKNSNKTPTILAMDKYTDSGFFENFKKITFFSESISVGSKVSSNSAGKVKLFGATTGFPGSWGEKNTKEIFSGKIKYSEKEDLKGPLYIGGFLGNQIIAFGDTGFISNLSRSNPPNYELFLNSLRFVIDPTGLAANTSAVIEDEPIFINTIQKNIMFYFALVIAPLILLTLSFFFYQRRRG